MTKPWEERLKGWGRGVVTSENGPLRLEIDTGSVTGDEEAERFFAAASDMARALLGIIACAHADGETICARCLKDARAALTKTGVPLP